ncbi:MAG TPA: O-methyltransferase [Chitinophagaceae bacterium]|nr:O-methyltransferase [Chitinophagaceae bacterium]
MIVLNIIDPGIQEYAESLTEPEDELLREVNLFTKENHTEYQMLSGHLQGKLLEMISRMIQPRRILEIGTFTGYSALCLARGLAADGQLHTIELREKDAATARSFFDRSEYADRIILHTGNALEVIPALNETWDLVFIDADKVSYIEYFKIVLPQVRQNGFILADNIFFHGEVLEQPVKGKNAKAMIEFNEYVRTCEEVDKVAISLRDGLYLARKR